MNAKSKRRRVERRPTEQELVELREQVRSMASDGHSQGAIQEALDLEGDRWALVWKGHEEEHDQYQRMILSRQGPSAEEVERAERAARHRENRQALRSETHRVLAEWDRDRERAAEAEARKRLGLD